MPDPRLYDQLKNPDSARRAAAVKELARSKDPEAIPYLERTADHDDDSNVRDLAEKAIIYIKRNSGGNEAPVAPISPITPEKPASPIGDAVVGAAPVINQPPKIVTAKDEERSKRMLTDAITYNMKGNDLRAIQMISEAFKINPNLKNDKYAYGVISSITGMYGEEAIRAITDGSLLAATVAANKTSGKAKRGGGSNGGDGGKAKRDTSDFSSGESRISNVQTSTASGIKDVSLGGALLDLLIYGLVNGVLFGVTVFLAAYLLLSNLPPEVLSQPLVPGTPPTPGIPYTFGELVDFFTVAGAGLIILYSIFYAVSQIITLLIQVGSSHWVAMTFFSGDGTFSELLHRLSGFYTILVPILFLVQIGGSVAPLYIFSTTNDLNTASGVSSILGILSLALSIYALWGTATCIGRTYDFGAGSGCLTMIVSTIVLAVLCFGLTFGLAYLLSSSLGSFAAAMFAFP